MKVLLSAYACEPNRGSEPGAGFRTLLAAAAEHDVWLITRANNRVALEDSLATHPDRSRIHLETFDLPAPLRSMKKKLGIVGMHVYYALWQRRAGRVAVELDKVQDFDIVHHATFANYWTSTGVARLRKPMVWGPIGGGVDTPTGLRRELGVRGRLVDRARAIGRGLFYVLSRHPSDAIVLAQNHETLARLRGHSASRVLPNALAVDTPRIPVDERSGVVFVGRLIPWKGACLAVRAFGLLDDPGRTLTIFGEGPERGRIAAEIARLGLGDRVRIAGVVPRDDMLRSLASAEAMIHTAFREEAGWGVAEALSYGTPVVCLEIGGPRVLADSWVHSPVEMVSTEGTVDVAVKLAEGLRRALVGPTPVVDDPLLPKESYGDAILSSYSAAAATEK